MITLSQTVRFRSRPPSRSGFTILEATIVSMLMAFLAVLISTTWSTFVKPVADMALRGRVAQEASLAVAALSRDLAGNLADDSGGSQSKFAQVGRMQPANTQLRLCFDGGTTPDGVASWSAPDYVISYYLDADKLIRWNENAGTTFVVARYVDTFEVLDLGGGQVRINLTFRFRTVTQTYTLIARDP